MQTLKIKVISYENSEGISIYLSDTIMESDDSEKIPQRQKCARQLMIVLPEGSLTHHQKNGLGWN